MHQDQWITHGLMLLCFGGAVGLFGLGQLSSPNALTVSPTPPMASEPKISQDFKPLPPSSQTRLVVDLSERNVSLYYSDQLQKTYPVAVGKEGWETPTGEFQVQQMISQPVWRQPITGETIPPGPDNPLGDRWIGFWSEGELQFGFHGSNQESLIGEAVSHGCLRMHNQDIRAIFNQVIEGTPVLIHP